MKQLGFSWGEILTVRIYYFSFSPLLSWVNIYNLLKTNTYLKKSIMDRNTFYKNAFLNIVGCQEEITKIISSLQNQHSRLSKLYEILENSDIKKCPVCDNSMRDLTSFINNQELLYLFYSHFSFYTMEQNYGNKVPKKWECQNCLAFDTRNPSEKARIWDDDLNQPGKNSLAYLLFDVYPHLDEIALDYSSYGQSWMVNVKGEWYSLPGSKQEIMERLAL